MSIPWSSFAKEICFHQFRHVSPADRRKTAVAPAAPRNRAATGASRRATSIVVPCDEM